MSIFDRLVWKNEGQGLIKRREQAAAELASQLRAHMGGEQPSILEDPEQRKAFSAQLKKGLDRYLVRPEALQGKEGGGLPPVDAAAYFYVTKNRMEAYACLFPPMDGGKEMDLESFWEDMRYEGVSQGVLEEEAAAQVGEKRYLQPFLVARGTPGADGEDGQVIEMFERREAFQLEAAEGAQVDFAADNPIQVVRKGEIICQIQLPVAGKPGTDVTGQRLPAKDGVQAQIPAGENTALSEDGRFLIAEIDGAVSISQDRFQITRLMIIPGDLYAGKGPVSVTGDLYVAGNITQGAQVEALGDIIVAGSVQGAKIRSAKGSVRIQKGAKEAQIQALRQVQSQVMEGCQVQAGGSVFAEVSDNSQVTSGGSVSVLGGRGLILGGHVRADSLITCKKIGNLSGQHTQVTVGYSPALMQAISQSQGKLEEVRGTLEKLRKSISALRAAGELLSLEKRAVLSQLMEQRTLYEKQEADLAAQLKTHKQTLHAATAGKILCQELYPLVTVRIGDREAQLKTADTNCRIHVYAGQISTK